MNNPARHNLDDVTLRAENGEIVIETDEGDIVGTVSGDLNIEGLLSAENAEVTALEAESAKVNRSFTKNMQALKDNRTDITTVTADSEVENVSTGDFFDVVEFTEPVDVITGHILGNSAGLRLTFDDDSILELSHGRTTATDANGNVYGTYPVPSSTDVVKIEGRSGSSNVKFGWAIQVIES